MRRRAFLQTPLLALLGSGHAHAEVRLPLRLVGPTSFRLANGLDVVLQRTSHSTNVAVAVEYDAGARDDPEGYAQLAHVVEHMTFRGSRHLPRGDGSALLAQAGCRTWNGMTELDRTSFFSVLPGEHVGLPLWLESERLAFTLETMSDASLVLEKQVVENELRLRGHLQPSFLDLVRQGAFGQSHLYAPRTDVLADLHAIDLNAVRWFFQTHYRPDRARLVVVGNFEEAVVRDLLERYFAPIGNPIQSRPRAPLVTPRAFANRRVSCAWRTRTQSVAAVHWAPPPTSPDRPAFDVGAAKLRRAFEGEVASGRSLFASVDVSTVDLQGGSLLHVVVEVSNRQELAEVETRLLEALRRLTLEVVRGPELGERTACLHREMQRTSDLLGLAERHAGSLRTTGKAHDVAAGLRAIAGVTKEDVATAMGRYVLGVAPFVAVLEGIDSSGRWVTFE